MLDLRFFFSWKMQIQICNSLFSSGDLQDRRKEEPPVSHGVRSLLSLLSMQLKCSEGAILMLNSSRVDWPADAPDQLTARTAAPTLTFTCDLWHWWHRKAALVSLPLSQVVPAKHWTIKRDTKSKKLQLNLCTAESKCGPQVVRIIQASWGKREQNLPYLGPTS